MKHFDFLSPPITLFIFEKRTHTSKFGAILVFLLIIICLFYSIFLLYNYFAHKKINFAFYKKYIFDDRYYSFNSSSLFHFIQIYSNGNGGYFDKFDSKYIRAFTTYSSSNLSYNRLDLSDHWVFDECRKGIDDTELIPSLLEKIDNFTNAVCIRYYYNSFQKKYYSIEDEGFKWPKLEHDFSKRNNIYLTTMIQKCSNNSLTKELFGVCPPQKEIDNYLRNYLSFDLYLINNQVDPNNYKIPITKFLNFIRTKIRTSQTYEESFLYFSPINIKTKINSLFEETYNIHSFYLNFHETIISTKKDKDFTITKFNYLLQNNAQIYERKIENIFEIFSEIGGITQFFIYIFYWINYIYNQFIIDFDTNHLFFSIRDNSKKNKEKSNIKTTSIANKINITGNDNRIFNIQNNIVKLSRKGTKKFRNSKFYVDNNNKNEDKNNYQEYNINIKPIQVNKEDDVSSEIRNNTKMNNEKILLRKEKTLIHKKNNDDNSKEIIHNLNLKKKFDLIENQEANIKSNILNNAPNNSNRLNLRYNKTIIRSNKEILNLDINNKLFWNIEDENKITPNKQNDIYTTNIYDLPITKASINKMNYGKLISIKTDDKNNKRTKTNSFFYYMKSFFLNKSKENYHYLALFRRHLLSEEHLLKSHINLVLLGKKNNINENEATNVFECFNEL